MLWPEGFLRVIDGPAAVVIGARDAQMRPRSTRGMLVRRGAGADELLVFALPEMAAYVLPNLRDNGAVAVMVSLPDTHETYQVKGKVTSIQDAPASEEAAMRDRMGMLREQGARMGLPRKLIDRVIVWPALIIQIQATQLFHQSPGPGAGERVRA